MSCMVGVGLKNVISTVLDRHGMNDMGVDVFELIQWYHTFTEKGVNPVHSIS